MNLIINDCLIFENVRLEQTKKMISLCSDMAYTEQEFYNTLNLIHRKEVDIEKALGYAKQLDFSKNSLKFSYLSHPIRLATFLIKFEPKIETDYIIIALLHNVPETTNISNEEIQKVFGEKVASGIKTLVVDRSVPFLSIQDTYYKEIFSRGHLLTLIKLLDKIDNLFVLCLNPDENVRRSYIDEIRDKLLPFAISYNQQLGNYLNNLLDFASEIGFSKELKNRLAEYQQSL